MESILLVEDNLTTRKLVCFALEQRGYVVIEAADGKAALEAVEKCDPDLVLQDLNLPDMDGFELAVQLRALLGRRRRVPILAFSGLVARRDEARLAAAGFDDVVVKPVAPSRLLAIIQAHLPVGSSVDAEQFGDGRLLIVADDDPLQAKLASFRLERLGFKVEIAGDGVEAIELARAHRPVAIVSDIMMPNADGFLLCIETRRDPALQNVPVILMTSNYIDREDHKLAESAGANACVLRTPDLKEVIAALRCALVPKTGLAVPPQRDSRRGRSQSRPTRPPPARAPGADELDHGAAVYGFVRRALDHLWNRECTRAQRRCQRHPRRRRLYPL